MDEFQRLKQKDLLEAYKIAKVKMEGRAVWNSAWDYNHAKYTVNTLAAKIADLVEKGEWIHE